MRLPNPDPCALPHTRPSTISMNSCLSSIAQFILLLFPRSEINHYVFVSEEKHDRAWVIKLIHCVEVRYLIDINTINDSKVLDFIGDARKSLLRNGASAMRIDFQKRTLKPSYINGRKVHASSYLRPSSCTCRPHPFQSEAQSRALPLLESPGRRPSRFEDEEGEMTSPLCDYFSCIDYHRAANGHHVVFACVLRNSINFYLASFVQVQVLARILTVHPKPQLVKNWFGRRAYLFVWLVV